MPTLEQCSETGLWLLPRGSHSYTRWLPSWDDLRSVARPVVLSAIETTQGSDEGSWHVPVTLGLLPDPGNTYNPQAVAVVIPDPLTRRLEMTQQIAWLRDSQVRSLQPSITALMDATGDYVGCHGIIQVSRYVAGEDYSEEDPPDDDEDWGVLSGSESRRLERTFEGFRASVHSWDVVRHAVLEVIVGTVTDRIVPVIKHRSPLTPEARPVRADLRARGRMQVLLRAEEGCLHAYLDGLLLSRLHPEPRAFFAATCARVLALGGTATAQAEAHAGSLEVWVEDSRPPG